MCGGRSAGAQARPSSSSWWPWPQSPAATVGPIYLASSNQSVTFATLAAAPVQTVTDLSGGQRQRVAVARVLAGEPDIVIADDPTSELDADSRHRVLRLLLDLAARGSVVILATHDPEVADCCDDWFELVDGRLRPWEDA